MWQALEQCAQFARRQDYQKVQDRMTKALRAGTSVDIGHDWNNQIQERYDASVRHCTDLPWPILTDVTNGGLAKGQLGVIVGTGGGGKCVGKDTQIQIQYQKLYFQVSDTLTLEYDP